MDKQQVTDELINFLHDVIAVEATAGNELNIKEQDFIRLAEDYASHILGESWEHIYSN